MIALNLSKQHALDSDPKVVYQINSARNLDYAGNITMFFIIEEVKETLQFFTRNFESLINESHEFIFALT